MLLDLFLTSFHFCYVDIDMDADVEVSSNDGSVISAGSTVVKRSNNHLNVPQRK